MYSIITENHSKYSNIINISVLESGEFLSPFDVYEKLKYLKRVFKEKNPEIKLIYLVCDKIMKLSQIKSWAKEEYKFLAKCENCAKILNNEVFEHKLSNHLFCSKKCSDQNYIHLVSIQESEEEHDFYL